MKLKCILALSLFSILGLHARASVNESVDSLAQYDLSVYYEVNAYFQDTQNNSWWAPVETNGYAYLTPGSSINLMDQSVQELYEYYLSGDTWVYVYITYYSYTTLFTVEHPL